MVIFPHLDLIQGCLSLWLRDAVLNKKLLCSGAALFLKISSLQHTHSVNINRACHWLALGETAKGISRMDRRTGSARGGKGHSRRYGSPLPWITQPPLPSWSLKFLNSVPENDVEVPGRHFQPLA